MKIQWRTKTSPTVSTKVANLLRDILEVSRFSADVSVQDTRVSQVVRIVNVRLRQGKAHCGNHPNACENGGTREEEQPHRKSKYLEGADWVEFHDLVNDLLDRLHLSARFESSQMIMRIDCERRTYYGSIRPPFGQGWIWDKKGDSDDFQNFCGESAPDSTFPEGTPGQYKTKYYEVG